MTYVDKELDKVLPPHEFRNNEDEAVYHMCMLTPPNVMLLRRLCTVHLADRTFSCADDPELLHGLPVGLQLIGRMQEEEAVIAMTEAVDKALFRYRLI